MQKKDPHGFNIRFDDDDEKPSTPSEISSRLAQDQIDQLRKRVSRLVVLLFVLIGVLAGGAAFFHLEVRERVMGRGEGEGSEIDKLSERLESGLSALSVRQAKVESALEKNRAALEKNAKSLQQAIAPLKKDLTALDKKLPGIQSGLKSLKKDLGSMRTRMAALQKNLAPLEKEMASLGGRVTLTEKAIYKKIRETLKGFADDLAAAEARDRKELAAAITDLQKELSPLQKKLDDAFTQIQGLDNSLTQETSILAADLENASRDISRLESEIAASTRETNKKLSRVERELSASTSTAVTFELLDEKLKYEQYLYRLKLEDLDGKLSNRIKKVESRLGVKPKSNPSPPEPVTPPPGAKKPPTAPPAGNGIAEENLQ